jgi:NADPH:quinone reductase-like Zn-dependent oxidoreductase
VILRERPDGSLIHAAAGGVGSAKVTLAHALGAKTVFTASGQKRIERVSELGGTVSVTTANTTPSMRRSMLSTVEAYGGGTTEITMVKAPYTPIVHDAETTRVHSGGGVAASKAF